MFQERTWRMTEAGRLTMLMNLYEQGLLCKCTDWRFDNQVDQGLWAGEVYKEQLHHESNCEGPENMRKLLAFPTIEK